MRGEKDKNVGDIVVREDWHGTYGGTYYYVKEDKILRHIGEYAISKKKVTRAYESSKGPTFEYEIPMAKIGDKEIYCFSFTRYFIAKSCKIEAFLKGGYYPDPNLMRYVSREELKELEIEIKDPLLKKRIEEIKTDYAKMIHELESYKENLNFEMFFFAHAEEILRDPKFGYFSCLALPDDESRLRALEVLMRRIYQLWIMRLICEALNVEEIAFTAKDENGRSFSLWFEFQPSKGARIVVLLLGGRVGMRPDIVVCKGFFDHAKDVEKIDLLIECKNEEFEYWKAEVQEQMTSYIELYKPVHVVLVSMKSIPLSAKRNMESKGINVFDELSPRNGGRVLEFRRFISALV